MISVIIPTYNESKNISVLLPKLYKTLLAMKEKFEILVVDDNSPDKTWQVAGRYSKYHVKVIRRRHARGLSSAVIEGFNNSKRDSDRGVFIVMDADLSHPPGLIPKMLKASKGKDIVVASRHIGNGASNFSLYRKVVSFTAKLLSRPLTSVSDPMSGFFLVRKTVIDGVSLKPKGYKILLEILVKGNYTRNNNRTKKAIGGIAEVPFVFEKRIYGKSKLGLKVSLDYVRQIFSLYFYKLFH